MLAGGDIVYIFWSTVWLCCAFVALAVCVKWQLQKLTRLPEETHVPSAPDPDVKSGAAYGAGIKARLSSPSSPLRRSAILIAFLCSGLLACLCGYRASQCAGSILSILKLLLAFCVLECTAATDLKSRRIPNLYILLLLAGRIVFLVLELIFTYEGTMSRLISSVAGGFVCLLFLLLMNKISRGGLGYGDIKLFAALGFLCGFYGAIYTLLFACVLCAATSAGLLLLRKKTRKDSLPMGPFVLLGYGIAILLGAY